MWFRSTALVVCLAGALLAVSSAQDTDTKLKKKLDTLAEAVKRAYVKIHNEGDDQQLARTTVLLTHDDQGTDAVLLVAEYKGGLGLYLGSRDQTHDAWVWVDKDKADILEEAAKRVK